MNSENSIFSPVKNVKIYNVSFASLQFIYIIRLNTFEIKSPKLNGHAVKKNDVRTFGCGKCYEVITEYSRMYTEGVQRLLYRSLNVLRAKYVRLN